MKKVNAVRPKNENNFLRLLLSLKLAEYKIAAESFSEIVFFLVQYSFLFEDTEKVLNSCGTEQSQLYALQENRDLGARYLDAKYSRWISTDPALLSYVSGSTAGGGIYNSINFNLYHYGGNNPVRYTDPTGLFDWDTNTIQEGDTLSQIAKDCNTRYGTNYTADDLQGLNSDTISDKDKIYAGNHLNLGKAEDVQKRAADYTNRATTQYSNEQVTPLNVTSVQHVNVGLSLKAAVIGGLGLELGVSVDTNKNIGIYGTFYRGIGVQVGDGGSTTNVAKFLFNLMFGGGMSWSPGDIYSNNGSSFTADGGAGVLGTWDLKNENNRSGPLQTSGFGGIGVGGAVWWSNTGVLPLRRGKK